MSLSPLVICLHGFPDTPGSFDALAPLLRQGGYAVECPYLPGYASATQIPDGHYDLDTVSDHLLAAIESRRVSQSRDRPIHLVGHDWGAIAGFACVVKRPDLFASYTSLSIPYPLHWPSILRKAPTYLRAAWYIQLFQLPHVPELLIRRQGLGFIERLLASWSPGWQIPEEHLSHIKATLSSPGVLKAALAYYRSIPGLSRRCRRSRRLVSRPIEVPTLLVQGMRDACIPPALWRVLDPSIFTRGCQHFTVDAGHFPQQEKPDEVCRALLEHLNRSTG